MSNDFENVNADDDSLGLVGEDLLRYQLRKALDCISAQASTIEVLRVDKDRQYQKMKKIETENEELLADIQDLIEENKELGEELESIRKEKRELEVRNKQLECDNFMLLDELESKQLGWLSEFEVEELKRTAKEPLIWKLEVSRQERKQLEEHMRFLDAERDYLLNELTRAREKISILLIFASNELRRRAKLGNNNTGVPWRMFHLGDGATS